MKPDNYPYLTLEIKELAIKNGLIDAALLTYQELIDWFREAHDLMIVILPLEKRDGTIIYDPVVYSGRDDWKDEPPSEYFENYYDALIDALKYTFKHI